MGKGGEANQRLEDPLKSDIDIAPTLPHTTSSTIYSRFVQAFTFRKDDRNGLVRDSESCSTILGHLSTATPHTEDHDRMMDTSTANETEKESKSLPNTIKTRVTNLLVGKMAASAVAAVQTHLGISATSGQADTGRESPDDSGSSLSSVASETFDTIPDAQGNFLSKTDVNGILRYGSFDADETGLSSVASSRPSVGKRTFKQVESTPSSRLSCDGGDHRASKRVALSPDTPHDEHLNAAHSENLNLPKPSTDALLLASQLESESQVDVAISRNLPLKLRKSSKITRLQTEVRPSSSIPKHLSWEEYGRECVVAAHSSRLNPYALSSGEYRLLRSHITQSQVTTYLNIRNGILRLWTRNPMVSVTREEAVGCAKETRFFDLAYTAFRWLVRNGYINFGCVEVAKTTPLNFKPKKASKQKTIAVIGAGMSGLGCARQLEALFAQLGQGWTDDGELPPKVIVLEGRARIGGRVYSHPVRSQVIGSLPDGLRNTAEMGAQIVTGFEHGNPLNAIIRGQLGLRYHLMWDEVTMYDCDGKPVDHKRDMMVNKIHNDLLERTSDFRVKPVPVETLEGIPEFVEQCGEPPEIKMEEENATLGINNAPAVEHTRQQAVPPGFAKLQGRTQVVAGNSSSRTAAQAVKAAGWELRPGISRNHSINLDKVSKISNPTLGATMDEAVRQYQKLVELTPQDMRMLNWHYADLEYANAAMVSKLSLGGHDQDTGNEFEGRHAEVIGGYTQVPRGLMLLPSRLDVRFNSIVKKIKYSPDDEGMTSIECEDGEIIHADRIVLTSPLGVLKAQTIAFEPPLPDWKRGAIQRMGFGLLNKVILLFEHVFWDEKYDMFGLLNEAEKKNSMDPQDYASRRGRFYLIWNCVKNSGRPMLIALMAGNAAHEVETTSTKDLLEEVMGKLSKTFAPQHVPAPVEVIVTRWKRDSFARGTYSFVGPETSAGDYDVMAAPVGNLHFAGEATCGTHPATVHGAYLSGLRAAAEVVDSMIGPMAVPEPLVLPKQASLVGSSAPIIPGGFTDTMSPSIKVVAKRGRPPGRPLGKGIGRPPGRPAGRPPGRPPKQIEAISKKPEPVPVQAIVTPTQPINPYRSSNNSRSTEHEFLEAAIIGAILSEIGERPMKPGRPGVNPFLLFTNDNWNKCKEACHASKRASGGNAEAKASRNEIRAEVGRQWRFASDEIKQPYQEKCDAAQKIANEARAEYEKSVAKWDQEARRIRVEYVKNNAPLSDGASWPVSTSIEVPSSRKRGQINYTELSDGE